MARYLSAAWFERLDELVAPEGAAGAPPSGASARPPLVLQQVVRGTPEGDVHYHVLVNGEQARIAPGAADQPDLTFTSDYPTAAAVARGELSTQAALQEGRIRIGGRLDRVPAAVQMLSGARLDPLPAALRAETTY